MTKLELRTVYCVDAPDGLGMEDGWERLNLWKIPDLRSVRIFLSLDLGWNGEVGTNVFSLEICTTSKASEDGTFSKPRYVLLVDEFDWLKIKPQIRDRVNSCERETWEKSVAELRKHFVWEYETKQTTRKKLKPLPRDIFPEPDWDDDEKDDPDSVH